MTEQSEIDAKQLAACKDEIKKFQVQLGDQAFNAINADNISENQVRLWNEYKKILFSIDAELNTDDDKAKALLGVARQLRLRASQDDASGIGDREFSPWLNNKLTPIISGLQTLIEGYGGADEVVGELLSEKSLFVPN